MTNGHAAPQRFAAIRIEDGHETSLGTVMLDESGRLSVADAPADTDAARRLETMVKEVNETDNMHVDVPPRDDAPEFTLASAVIPRGHPQFNPALTAYIRKYYGVELRA